MGYLGSLRVWLTRLASGYSHPRLLRIPRQRVLIEGHSRSTASRSGSQPADPPPSPAQQAHLDWDGGKDTSDNSLIVMWALSCRYFIRENFPCENYYKCLRNYRQITSLVKLHMFPVSNRVRYGSFLIVLVEMVAFISIGVIGVIPLAVEWNMEELLPFALCVSYGLLLLTFIVQLTCLVLFARYVWRRVHLPPVYAKMK
jgi:hypothetical protein